MEGQVSEILLSSTLPLLRFSLPFWTQEEGWRQQLEHCQVKAGDSIWHGKACDTQGQNWHLMHHLRLWDAGVGSPAGNLLSAKCNV